MSHNDDLQTIDNLSVLFEKWATMRTNWEFALAVNGTNGWGNDVIDQMNELYLSFRDQAKPLIRVAESYGIDAEPLRAICFSLQGGETEQGRAAVRAVLSKLEGAAIREKRQAPPAREPVVTEAERSRQPDGGGNRRLVWSIVRRTVLWLFILAELESAIGLCAWRWGAGENLWQRILSSSWLFGVMGGAWLLVFPFLLGRRRWRLFQFWRGDDK